MLKNSYAFPFVTSKFRTQKVEEVNATGIKFLIRFGLAQASDHKGAGGKD